LGEGISEGGVKQICLRRGVNLPGGKKCLAASRFTHSGKPRKGERWKKRDRKILNRVNDVRKQPGQLKRLNPRTHEIPSLGSVLVKKTDGYYTSFWTLGGRTGAGKSGR